MTAASENRKPYFLGLDAARGVAAMVVLTAHVPDRSLHALFPSAHLVIDLFFMLSGFVLANAYLNRFERGMGAIDFIIVRLIRLYPLYLLGTLLGALFFALLLIKGWLDVSWWTWGATLAANLLFLPLPTGGAFATPVVFPFNVPAWTLFWELASNIVFALLVLRLRGWKLALLIAIGLCLNAGFAFAHGNLDQGWAWSNFAGGAGRVWFSLFTGVALYRLWRDGRLPRFNVPLWFAALAPIVLIAIPATTQLRSYVDLAVITLLLPLLVAAAAHAEPRSKHGRRFAELAGRLSYGVYILQMPLIMFAGAAYALVFNTDLATLGHGGTLLIAAATLAFAWLADKFYDAPLRRRLTALHRQKAAQRAPHSSALEA